MSCSLLRVCHPRPLPHVSIPARASKRLGVWPTCCAWLWQIPAAWSGVKAAEPSPTKKKCQCSQWFWTPRTFACESSQLPCHLRSLSTNQLVSPSQTVTFPTSSFGTREKQSQRLPELSWNHGCSHSYKWGKCCLFSCATWSTTAHYTKSAAELPPLLQKNPPKLM